MSERISLAIVLVSRYTPSNDKVFSNYIDYIDRDEATRNYKFNDFSLFNDYMGNPEKSGSLFTKGKDFLTKNELESLKEKFKLAQRNGSVMWQDVFSFDNDWLVENGYYDSETNILNEEKLRGAVRKSMRYLLKEENLDTAIWSASFHYNTDNIHVHIATIDLADKPRIRGKRKLKTLDKMKSNFINELRVDNEIHKRINELIRDNIVKNKENFLSSEDRVLREKTLELLKRLPDNRKFWNYGYKNKLGSAIYIIDDISKYYINTYHKKEFEEFERALNKEELRLRKLYGDGKREEYKNYKQNKYEELYKRLGNAILKELREYAKEESEKKKEYLNKSGKVNVGDNKVNSLENNFKSEKNNNENDSRKNNKDDFKSSTNKEKYNKNYYKKDKDTNRNWDNFYEENIINEMKKGGVAKKKESVNYEKNNIILNRRTIGNLKKAMRNEVEKYINQREYERAERIREYESQRNNENEMEM